MNRRFRPGHLLLAGRIPEISFLILGAFLRFWRLGEKNLWWDEGLAVWACRKPFLETTLWTAADVHPPLFFWSLWPWLRMAGQSEFALRLSVAFTGILIMALAGALAARIGGRLAGRLTLLLLAISPFEIWWSMELRMYALAGLCILSALWASLPWLTGERPQKGASRAALAYLLSALAALHTIYISGIALVVINIGVGLTLLQGRLSRRMLQIWIVLQLSVMALLLPWWNLSSDRMQSWSSIEEASSLSSTFYLGATLMATGRSTDLESDATWLLLFWISFAVAGVLATIVGWSRWRSSWLNRSGLYESDLEGSGRHGSSPSESDPPRQTRYFVTRMVRSISVPRFTLLLMLFLPYLTIWAATQPRSFFYAPNIEARYFLPFAAPVYALASIWVADLWSVARKRGVMSQLRRFGSDRHGSNLGGSFDPAQSQSLISALAPLLMAGLLLPQLSGLPEHYQPRRLRDEHQSMVLAIWTQYEPGDALLLVSGDRYAIFGYHYDRPWDGAAEFEWQRAEQGGAAASKDELGGLVSSDSSKPAPVLGLDRPQMQPFPNKAAKALGQNDWQDRLQEIIDAHDRVWLAEVERHWSDPEGRVQAYLAESMSTILSEAYGPDALYLFEKQGMRADMGSDPVGPRLQRVSTRMPGVRAWGPFIDGEAPLDLMPAIGQVGSSLLPGDSARLTLFFDAGESVGGAGSAESARAEDSSVDSPNEVRRSESGFSDLEISLVDRDAQADHADQEAVQALWSANSKVEHGRASRLRVDLPLPPSSRSGRRSWLLRPLGMSSQETPDPEYESIELRGFQVRDGLRSMPGWTPDGLGDKGQWLADHGPGFLRFGRYGIFTARCVRIQLGLEPLGSGKCSTMDQQSETESRAHEHGHRLVTRACGVGRSDKGNRL